MPNAAWRRKLAMARCASRPVKNLRCKPRILKAPFETVSYTYTNQTQLCPQNGCSKRLCLPPAFPPPPLCLPAPPVRCLTVCAPLCAPRCEPLCALRARCAGAETLRVSRCVDQHRCALVRSPVEHCADPNRCEQRCDVDVLPVPRLTCCMPQRTRCVVTEGATVPYYPGAERCEQTLCAPRRIETCDTNPFYIDCCICSRPVQVFDASTRRVLCDFCR